MSDFDATAGRDAAAIPYPPRFDAPVVPVRPLKRWPFILVAVVLVVSVAIWVAGRWTVNYYAITPGDAQPVAPFIDVPSHLDHPLVGKILLTDVYVTQLSALGYLQDRYFSSDSQVISSADLLGPSTPEDQFIDQGYLEMSQAQSFATAAALSHLGYSVSPINGGTLIYGISAGSPASRDLKVAQVITKINGTPTPTDCSLISALRGARPGSVATLEVEQSSINDVGDFVNGPVVQKSVTLGSPPKGLTDTDCSGVTVVPTAFLGIDPETQQLWNFPVKVTVHTADIGGPSAGLSMTLGIIDKLSGGHLTGDRIVAATGTIDPQGDVGDVGGVAEKTIAVERAGATVFFVPPQELAAARSKDTASLHIYAVSSLDQALKILKALGGTVPPNQVSAQAAP
jgi:PDZ domain-containing protein